MRKSQVVNNAKGYGFTEDGKPKTYHHSAVQMMVYKPSAGCRPVDRSACLSLGEPAEARMLARRLIFRSEIVGDDLDRRFSYRSNDCADLEFRTSQTVVTCVMVIAPRMRLFEPVSSSIVVLTHVKTSAHACLSRPTNGTY